ncbi:MAG: sugar phosphate isomerase/epimerase, partial [Gammaproteobacteria bacterium]|nr:sugar phosphate isomerase/epimerase [Gammaproteobacteria bacterium]
MNKLAISNIAWHDFENKKIYELMTKLGIKGLEIAPSRLFSDPYNTSQQNIFAAKQTIENLGLRIVSLQSLLYKHNELKLFADTETRKYLKLHLKKAISLAGALSADVLIFGSPGNRIKGEMLDHRAEEISIDFFRDIGNYAREHNVCFLLEATPKQYGADFIVNTSEAISLVKKVNNANFQLNLDLGTMISNNANFASILEMALPITR